MRCKALDNCSYCDCDILWIDEDEGRVHYVPTGTVDEYGNEIEKTVCEDCLVTEFTYFREINLQINQWLYDKISQIN